MTRNLTLVICFLVTASVSAAEPKFDSKLITTKTPAHAVNVDVELSGARQLYLVVSDGGNGFACDWADWAEPRLIGPKGEKRLTELKWKQATTNWGRVRVNRNAGGGPLKIDGKLVAYGIGTHANSVIVFDLPAGYTRFRARAGLDNGGTDQGNGRSSSVRFLVYLEKPPASVTRSTASADAGKRDAADALSGLDVGKGLEATLFAAEPLLLSPSNIDVDHRGRVWVCEVVNYRRFRNTNNPYREKGDRILILEDTNGDGKADKKSVFYQGTDIDSAHGICVLGNKVIVSALDKVLVFTDENGDSKADKKEVLFSGFSGVQHDHGIHAMVFGPDGKLYFNFGNEGRQVKDKNGKPIIDLAGNEVKATTNPYQQGMVFRCNLDGSEFETLGWNFRNNWEVCVDSFGTLWQSDNDDDGNRGVRINFVMEFGNYGYRDELTGAGWRSPRTGMHAEIPKRHWHLHDPGVVPNLLQTGAGSPTGICVYEGRLLPKVFWDQIIHTDAGPNVVRAYPVKKDGAGYKAGVTNILTGARDQWFRPSDVCVAPDGSLIIADWYDPAVGGHKMGDATRGRLFRVAPPKTPYTVPKHNFATAAGAAEALKSPNPATRYLAWTALNKLQEQAEPALLRLLASDNPRHRARALWLLGNIKGRAMQTVEMAIADDNPDIRITGLRMVRRLKLDSIAVVRKLVRDPSPQVRRECSIALRHHTSSETTELWAELAAQHDGKDRWYLEALGIGAGERWDACFDAWLAKVGNNWNTPGGRDIIWRSRAKKTPEYLAMAVADSSVPLSEVPRYMRAFDFQTGSAKADFIARLAFEGLKAGAAKRDLIQREAILRISPAEVNKNPQYRQTLRQIVARRRGTAEFVSLVGKFDLQEQYPVLLSMAQQRPDQQVGVDAIRTLLAKQQRALIRDALRNKDVKVATNTAAVLGNSADGRAAGLLLPLAKNANSPIDVRRQAVRSLAKSQNGALELLKLARAGQLAESLKAAAAAGLHASSQKNIKQQAAKLFPLPPSKDNKPLPPLAQLLKMKGNVDKGKLVFNTTGTCAKCHVVNNVGKEVGPNLSEIGGKLSRHAFYDSILFPSAGISHNYETYLVVLESGDVLNGVMISQTADSVSIKGADAIVRTFKKSEIEAMKKQTVSLMPADLQKVMTAADLVNVVEYMTTLKKAKK